MTSKPAVFAIVVALSILLGAALAWRLFSCRTTVAAGFTKEEVRWMASVAVEKALQAEAVKRDSLIAERIKELKEGTADKEKLFNDALVHLDSAGFRAVIDSFFAR